MLLNELLPQDDIVLKENGKKIYETERKELIDIIKIVHLNFIKAYSTGNTTHFMHIIRLLQQMYYICMATTPMKIEYNAVTLNMLSYNQIYVHQHSSASIIRDTFHWPKI